MHSSHVDIHIPNHIIYRACVYCCPLSENIRRNQIIYRSYVNIHSIVLLGLLVL